MPASGPQGGARFAILSGCPRIWAVSGIHADHHRLGRLHSDLTARLRPRDGLVYLGNMIGRGQAVLATLDELVGFRAQFLARPSAFVTDHVFLRGSQEEMWHRLLELQFAAAPREVLDWMVLHGVGPTIEAYGSSAAQGHVACREGALGLTRWTGQLRTALRAHDGNLSFMTSLRRAAYTRGGELLFVNAGIDPSRPLAAQRDSFWWGGAGFQQMAAPYQGFVRVVRGHDRRHPGLETGPYTASVDGGCGFGGRLIAACFGLDGSVLDVVEV